MAELKKHALLLAIIGVLLLVKFIIVPVYEWQDNQLLSIKLLEKKQEKITLVLNNSDKNNQSIDQLKQMVDRVDAIFFPAQDESTFKLTQQQWLETLLMKHNLTLQNIGWQQSAEIADLALMQYSLEMSLTGNTLDIIEFMAALETNPHYVEINDFNLTFRGQYNNALGNINGRLVLNFYGHNQVLHTTPTSQNVSQGTA